VVPGTAIVEPHLAQLGVVRGGARKVAPDIPIASYVKLSIGRAVSGRRRRAERASTFNPKRRSVALDKPTGRRRLSLQAAL
jgi:hypothetical protein